MDLKGIGDNAFINDSTIISVKFGDRCISVGENAFKGCVSLSEINDDNVIETIGSNAFESTNLNSVKFNKLNVVDDNAFNSCSNLTSVKMPKCTDINGGAFQNCTSLKEIEIPNVSLIGVSAFEGCINLKKVTNNVRIATIVYNNAFKSCYNLKNIDFDSFRSIGAGAFIDCRSIDKLDLNSCETIGESAFEGCSNISQLTLSVCKNIGPNAFSNCSKLTKVYIKNNSDTFCKLEDEHVFCTNNESHEFVNDEILFYFNAEVLKDYSDDEKWSHYLGHMIPMANSQEIIYRTTDNERIEGIVNEHIKKHFYDGKSKYGLIIFDNDITSLTDIFKGKETLSSIDIPSKCTTIEANSFAGCKNLNSITLSDSLTQIGDYAFKNCESFTSFTIPESVRDLGEGIFAGCKNIEKISGNFVRYNGRAIVSGKKLIYVLPKDDSNTEGRIHKISEISTNITILGKSCFHGCEKMRRVDIPSTITDIGDNAFEGCKNLCEIHFSGATPPTLGDNVFTGVRSDFKIFVPEEHIEAYYNKWKDSDYISNILPKPDDKSIIYYGSKLASSTEHNDIFNNVPYYKISTITDKIVPSNYFTEQNLITTVIIGDGFTKISENAFKNCKNLNYIYLSDSISELNNQCFYGCEELTRIHIPSSVKKYTPVNKPVVNISPKTYVGSVTLGGSSIVDPTIVYIKSPLGNDIFCGCSKLKEFGTYYKGRVSDDNRCYIDNNTLMFFAQGDMSVGEKSYEIPNDITSINRSAFRGSQITNITLSESTETIGDYAFEGCSQLKSIYNWDNVKTISSCAFKDCSSLGEISLPSYLMTINQNAFEGCSEMYTNTDIPNSVVSIGSGAFRDCTNFKYVNTLGEDETLNLGSIKHINTYMFYNCESLTKININDNITIIDSNAFTNCLNLKSVSISSASSLENINENAFKGCRNLTELYLPNLTYIGTSAFEDCTNYKGGDSDLIIPSTLKSMGNACFKNSGIEKLSISNNSYLTEIPNSMCEDCTKLLEVFIHDSTPNIETIGTSAFKNCQKIKYISKGMIVGDIIGNKYGSLRLPNSVKTIKDSAFEGCNLMFDIYLPDKLSRIGDKSFSKPYSTNIYIPENLKTPPAITSDGLWGLANPFGDNVNYHIYIHYKIYDTYVSNLLWKKFDGHMSSYIPKDSDIPVIKPDNPFDPTPPIVTDPIFPEIDL